MATPLHGRDGHAYVGGTVIALVSEWTFSGGPTWEDITAMDSGGARQIAAGVTRWTGNITVRYATDDTNGQTVLFNSALSGAMVLLRLYPAGTAKYLSGSAGLTLDLSVSHDAPDEATYNFESNGQWTYT